MEMLEITAEELNRHLEEQWRHGFKIGKLQAAIGNSRVRTFVDLGLPSGTLWATCNVGATRPEECGSYFAWGETEQKPSYDSDYYHLNPINNNPGKYSFYNQKFILDPCDDAATVNWKEGWRMPTDIEFKELLDSCSNEWTERNGMYGRMFTRNGNSIFLPAAGHYNGHSRYGNRESACYWSSSFNMDRDDRAWGIYFDSNKCCRYSYDLWEGYSVRPVCSPRK